MATFVLYLGNCCKHHMAMANNIADYKPSCLPASVILTTALAMAHTMQLMRLSFPWVLPKVLLFKRFGHSCNMLPVCYLQASALPVHPHLRPVAV